MLRRIWRRLALPASGVSAAAGADLRSDLGWHSLRANAGAVLAARLLVPALNVVLVVAIARLGGAASLGQYTLLVTLFVLCENLKSLGLTTHMVRDVARHGDKALEQYRSLVRIGMYGALVTAPIIFIIAAHSNGSLSSLKLPAVILCLGLIPSAFIFANDALFLAIGRAHLTLVVTLAENLLRLIASILSIFLWHGGITALCAIYAGSRLFAAVAQQILIRKNLRLSLPTYQRSVTRAMLRSAPAFAVVFVVPLILFRMDVVFLGVLTSDYQVGVYSAAMRLVTLCLIVPDGVMTATFALLSKLADGKSGDGFKHLVARTVEFVTGLLLPLAVGGSLFAPFILRLLYGAKFDAAIPVMRTLMWALVPFGVNRALGDALVARGEQDSGRNSFLTNVLIGAVALRSFDSDLRPRRRGASVLFLCAGLQHYVGAGGHLSRQNRSRISSLDGTDGRGNRRSWICSAWIRDGAHNLVSGCVPVAAAGLTRSYSNAPGRLLGRPGGAP